MQGELAVGRRKDGDEVVLEGAYGAFGLVASMHSRWSELIIHFIVLDGCPE